MDNKTIRQCNVCGSDRIKIENNHISIPVPYGPSAEFDEVTSICEDCEAAIDITDDTCRERTVEQAEKIALDSIIHYFVETGISMANIERSLDLPQRTISRWKSGQEPSSAGMALLRIIRTYPWILDVAEKRFDSSVAKSVLLQIAFDSLMTSLKSNNLGVEVGAFQEEDTCTVYATLSNSVRTESLNVYETNMVVVQ